jgi:hypothetical protein
MYAVSPVLDAGEEEEGLCPQQVEQASESHLPWHAAQQAAIAPGATAAPCASSAGWSGA